MRQLVPSLTTPALATCFAALLVNLVGGLLFPADDVVLGIPLSALISIPLALFASFLTLPVFACVWIAAAEHILGGKASSGVSIFANIEERTGLWNTLRRPLNIALIVAIVVLSFLSFALAIARFF